MIVYPFVVWWVLTVQATAKTQNPSRCKKPIRSFSAVAYIDLGNTDQVTDTKTFS